MIEFCSAEGKTFESNLGVVMNHQQPSELEKLVRVYTELKFEVFQTQTMSGKKVDAVSYFGQKNT